MMVPERVQQREKYTRLTVLAPSDLKAAMASAKNTPKLVQMCPMPLTRMSCHAFIRACRSTSMPAIIEQEENAELIQGGGRARGQTHCRVKLHQAHKATDDDHGDELCLPGEVKWHRQHHQSQHHHAHRVHHWTAHTRTSQRPAGGVRSAVCPDSMLGAAAPVMPRRHVMSGRHASRRGDTHIVDRSLPHLHLAACFLGPLDKGLAS